MSAIVESFVFLPGLLDPPTGVEIDYHNITHQVLRWTPPFTLDLTAYQDDITSYSVTLEMENPLHPCDPYDLSVFRDDLSSTSHQSWSVSGQSPQFFFPRYSFPVWLSVRAENPVGLGAPSPLLKYSPLTSPLNCTRLRGEGIRSGTGSMWSNGLTLQMWCQALTWKVKWNSLNHHQTPQWIYCSIH